MQCDVRGAASLHTVTTPLPLLYVLQALVARGTRNNMYVWRVSVSVSPYLCVSLLLVMVCHVCCASLFPPSCVCVCVCVSGVGQLQSGGTCGRRSSLADL
ncbi:unnamed protein product [Danaus chrysippus]|uniref:(African queen) hypothetical protein n=1 Tax=Danaus chrysippus TaxID=151541 RepID=A0A8J2VWE8_9NEOP|nr:unnamed protein product [Danaus chrysippus]